ncbi:E2F-associated phosphoprotein-like [Ptychodera flava]|uniref:E2F-associated phosphoprotein-like n=1 Tax=Ptychodera flava TaxID=63121 RepID=UPI003969CDAE
MADYDDYCIFEDSDDEDRRAESSEDELQIILHGTPKQKRRLCRSLSRGSLDLTDASSSGDEFEKEVEAELDATMRSLEEQHKNMGAHTLPGAQSASTSGTQGQPENKASSTEKPSLAAEFYDDIYFDSDSGDEDNVGEPGDEGKKKRKTKHRVLTNEELFYDPNIDEQNELWMNRQRDMYRSVSAKGGSAVNSTSLQGNSGTEQKAAANTDAVLNCPACMTLLCLDCQRHEVYVHQYRAMFVVNCMIVRDEILRYKEPPRKAGRKKRRKHKPEFVRSNAEDGETSVADEEVYHPVKCGVCNTEVAVYDSDEVYHFHNVLSSAP